MTRSYRLAARAKADLATIWEYHAERISIRIADELLDRIRVTLEQHITRHPLSGKQRPEFGPGVRSFPVPPYVLFYSVESRTVNVLRILHGHRDIRPPLMSLLIAV
jgi:toxin ParE1/3/4